MNSCLPAHNGGENLIEEQSSYHMCKSHKYHLWAQSSDFSREKFSSDLKIANFKPKLLSLKSIHTHAEPHWKEYLSQFYCSPWGCSSHWRLRKTQGHPLPGGDESQWPVLLPPVIWKCHKSGADLDIPVPSHPLSLGCGVQGNTEQ